MHQQYFLQIMLTKGLGDAAVKRMINYCKRFFDESINDVFHSPRRLSQILRCSESIANTVIQNESQAVELINILRKNKVSIITELSSEYPARLRESLGSQCPPVLFVKGNLSLLSSIAVGFCGSRKVSSKGIQITSQCAEQLVAKDITVVSGYAAGTDLAAHSAAIEHGGNTIFVLAEGILQYSIKPAIKHSLTENNHLFVSQFMPNSIWNVGNAMKRNLVIIGLSKAMILVESGKTGGTFAAGEESLKRSLPLFVIDYAKPEVSAEANPYFIAHGGQPIRGKNGIPALEKVFYAIESTNYSVNQEQLSLNLCVSNA